MSHIHTDILKRYIEMLEMHMQMNTRGRIGINGLETSFAHLRWMLVEIPNLTDIGKANRWLGYVQGILIANGLTTVEVERNFTRPYFQEKG